MKNKIFLLLAIFLTIGFSVTGQEHLQIKNVFDKYGKQDGSVLLQLSSDILSQGSNITLYKSLVTNENSIIENDIVQAIKTDIRTGVILSEIKKSGKLESGSYYLGKDKDSNHDFILYKKKSKKITLVYIRGNFPPEELDNELKKLKQLFIYVNNKRLKLE